MGHCNRIIGYKIEDVGRPITYEAMFENWGECQETEALSQGFYYQHPNSVSLYLSIVDKMCIMPL